MSDVYNISEDSKYPKIETLYNRGEDHKVDERAIRCPEFSAIRAWHVTEKIDGTNMRITFERKQPGQPCTEKPLDIRGRTDNAQLSKHVLDIFRSPQFDASRWDSLLSIGMRKMIIYGEAFGPKIQSGGSYCPDGKCRFAAFDMWIDGWWLEQRDMKTICEMLGVHVVPTLPFKSLETAVEYVRSRPPSLIGEVGHTIEGVVATSKPLMLFRNGRPIKWKLKVRDFR